MLVNKTSPGSEKFYSIAIDSEKVPRGKPIILEKDSWIGPNCLILPGVKIGYGAIISPFTIIKKNINPLSIVDNNGNKSKDRDFSL